MTRCAVPIALLILAATGCGQDTITATFSSSLTWPQATATCDDTSGLAGMSAELWIGGHSPCALDVNATTFEATGECTEILPGIDRPLVIYYYLDNGSDPDHALLFCIGFVDLRPESLPVDTADSIDLVLCDDPGALLVYEESFMADLPAYDDTETDPLERAKMYTRYIYYYDTDGVLDSDADGCPNLVETCNGTLDDAGNTDC